MVPFYGICQQDIRRAKEMTAYQITRVVVAQARLDLHRHSSWILAGKVSVEEGRDSQDATNDTEGSNSLRHFERWLAVEYWRILSEESLMQKELAGVDVWRSPFGMFEAFIPTSARHSILRLNANAIIYIASCRFQEQISMLIPSPIPDIAKDTARLLLASATILDRGLAYPCIFNAA